MNSPLCLRNRTAVLTVTAILPSETLTRSACTRRLPTTPSLMALEIGPETAPMKKATTIFVTETRPVKRYDVEPSKTAESTPLASAHLPAPSSPISAQPAENAALSDPTLITVAATAAPPLRLLRKQPPKEKPD